MSVFDDIEDVTGDIVNAAGDIADRPCERWFIAV